jgi:UDP-N-acetylenolpyruvoylglucosamine reductase
LEKFEGVGRRFDVKFEDKDFLVVDDYAHHPTEIRKTLEAAKALKKNRILAVFQPHRYSRTEFLMKDFESSFFDADQLFVTDIYAASEQPREGVSGESLCRAIALGGHANVSYEARKTLVQRVKEAWLPGDLIITMGAGDITQASQEISNALNFPGVRGKILKNEPLSKHTSLKIGGPADFWIEPEDLEDLAVALKCISQKGKKLAVMGLGSNILPSDYGFRGVVLHLGSPAFRAIRVENDKIICGAGLANTLFIQFALENGFGGFEFLSGIPGNIGGAIAMNAGSHGQWVERIVESFTVVAYDGCMRSVKKEEALFSYRSCGIQKAIVTEVVFRLPKVPREVSQMKLNEYHDYRMKTQDLQYPSAGCLFKNPKGVASSSGKLIDEAGLKGRRVGNAQVSMKHANFMINLGGASSSDMLKLIEEVQREVKVRFNVELEMEAKIL